MLGVATSGSLWAEWLTCGPLLLFTAVSVGNKSKLNRADVCIMISFYLCILFGFLIITSPTYEVGIVFLLLSIVTYLPILCLPFLSPSRLLVKTGGIDVLQRTLQRNLIMTLTIVFPLFSVNYLLALFHVIDAMTTVLVYQTLSLLVKVFFSIYAMDIHTDSALAIERTLHDELIANESRRSFMKFIFHEVPMLYLPCSSIRSGFILIFHYIILYSS